MTIRLSLEQVVSAADRAFVGRVVAVRSGRDRAGLPSTWVTFSVMEAIKGVRGSKVTIKQIGAAEPLSDGSVYRIPGVPSYKPGDEMVLFLAGKSPAGFSSPIGLSQGKFPIVHRDGHAFVTATLESAGAVSGALRAQTSTPIQSADAELDQFLTVVLRLVADNGGR